MDESHRGLGFGNWRVVGWRLTEIAVEYTKFVGG